MLDSEFIARILGKVASGELSEKEALSQMRFAPFEQLIDGLSPDLHRMLRTGMPETVFASGKSNARLIAAVKSLMGEGLKNPVLVSRVSEGQGLILQESFPQGSFWPEAALFCVNKDISLDPPWPPTGDVMIVTAGTSDLPVALEALGTALFHDVKAGLACDIGVAGIHRLSPWLPVFEKATVLIVVAGMEGALPSVIAGLTGKPVVAVPTSVGYGVSKGGFAALAGMLSSCAPGISVVNIDNGYGAAMFAARLIKSSR